MHGIPRTPGCRAYSSVGREVGAVCVERLAVSIMILLSLLLEKGQLGPDEGINVAISVFWGPLKGLATFNSLY